MNTLDIDFNTAPFYYAFKALMFYVDSYQSYSFCSDTESESRKCIYYAHMNKISKRKE